MNTSMQKTASAAASASVGMQAEAAAGHRRDQHERSHRQAQARSLHEQAEQDDGGRHQRQRLHRDVADRRAGNDKGPGHGGKADGNQNERQDDREIRRPHAPRGAQLVVLRKVEKCGPEDDKHAPGKQVLGIASVHGVSLPSGQARAIYPIAAVVSSRLPKTLVCARPIAAAIRS